ncbi:MAG: CapA family protein [Actinobacteria bacterium]|nr:CapA family protein [Actinomycetota bacterium]
MAEDRDRNSQCVPAARTMHGADPFGIGCEDGETRVRSVRMLGKLVIAAASTAAVTIAVLSWWPVVLPQFALAAHDPVTWPTATNERTVPRPPDPVERFTIVAVGDLMCHQGQIAAAKTASGYDFKSCFAPVAPRLSAADLAIGNLETVVAGSASGFTGFPTFNTPDEYVQAAVVAGFDVLTNANNHTLDRGPAGLSRTLDVLDGLGVMHTGTARTAAEAGKVLVADVRGVKVAVLAYTYGMNGFTAPSGKPWMVDTIDQKQMATDVNEARSLGADLVIVSIHNGVEYQRQPSAAQVAVERAMVDAGADVVLGSHPHVIQPMETVQAVRADGSPRTAFIIHSLGNFVSNQRERYRDTGLILQLEFEKNLKTGATTLLAVSYVPVWVDDTGASGKEQRVLPIADVLADTSYPGVTGAERTKAKQAWDDTTTHLGSIDASSTDPASVPFYRAEGYKPAS